MNVPPIRAKMGEPVMTLTMDLSVVALTIGKVPLVKKMLTNVRDLQEQTWGVRMEPLAETSLVLTGKVQLFFIRYIPIANFLLQLFVFCKFLWCSLY